MTASAVVDPLAHLSSEEELQRIDAWWRAANYVAVGMIYLRANPLLAEPLRHEHIKARLLGRWGSSPGQAFIWAHANRLIRRHQVEMIYLSGPGHGAPGVLGPKYLDGTDSEVYPDKSQDAEGLERVSPSPLGGDRCHGCLPAGRGCDRPDGRHRRARPGPAVGVGRGPGLARAV